MVDMLVPLYVLPRETEPRAASYQVRRALAPERHAVIAWVEARFGPGWAGECEAAFAATPTRCLIAVEDGALLGFAAWDVTALGFFGPTGVAEAARGKGVGAALLLGVLRAMQAAGYGYAIIGAAGAPTFFAKVAGAVPIAGSSPGLYRGMLKG
jgi:GNAT superfamily N-acetyltransferase